MSSAAAVDASLYPRTYRVSFLRTAGNTALIILFMAASFLRFMPPTQLLMLLGLVAFVMIFLLRSVHRVTLYADRIEVATWSKTRTVRRDQIAGHRVIGGKMPMYAFDLNLGQEFEDGSGALQVSRNIRTDPAWDAWLADLPDLDAQARVARAEARAAQFAEIEGSAELGATPAARVAHWKWAVWGAWRLWMVTLILSLLLGSGPATADIAVLALAATPWLALIIVTVWMPAFSRPGLAGPIPILLALLPVPGLPLAFVHAGLSFHYVTPLKLVGETAALLAVLTGVAVFCVRKNVTYIAIVSCAVFLLSGLYCYQVISIANYRLDPGQSKLFAVLVKAKSLQRYMDGQRHTHMNYQMVLAPWGPEPEETPEVVSSGDFATYRIGDTVCAELHSGGLGIEWYRIVIPYSRTAGCD